MCSACEQPLHQRQARRERQAELTAKIANELTTTFASSYSNEISLSGALQSDNIRSFQRKATGRKYLINPSLG